MNGTIRNAGSADVPRMVELSEKKRTEYEQQQPIFWRKARDSASAQKPYFEHLLTLDSTIVLVYECEGTIQGFVIASLHTAPPVYDPGGLTCNIDDFVVGHSDLWSSVGRALLDRATIEARARKAVQVVVVTGGHDRQKREMLSTMGLSLASEWWVSGI